MGVDDELDSGSRFPGCQQCGTGTLLPLSDYDRDGAELVYKVWVCSNPDCGFNLKIRRGDIIANEVVADGTEFESR